MSFEAYRDLLIEKLQSGEYAHEPRDVMEEKNLLAVGVVSAAEVVRLVRRCTRQQYRQSAHHRAPRITVHIFQPVDAGAQPWYIKVYFLKSGATFISVHRS
jgi:hypothetical protein